MFFLLSRCSSPFWKLLHIFQDGIVLYKIYNRDLTANSAHVPFGLSVHFSKFHVSCELGPTNMKYPGLNFPKQAAFSVSILQNFPPSGPGGERNFAHHSREFNSVRVGFWSEVLPIFSLTLSNPFTDFSSWHQEPCGI